MKILLATDGSDTARAAADYLLTFPLPATTQITVVSVIQEVLPLEEVEELSSVNRLAFDEVRRHAEDEARSLLEQTVERIQQAGWHATSEIRHGNPSRQIVTLARELDSDIIVVGSHGHGDAKRFLLGSTSDRVLESAPCSVLIVRHPAATAGIDASALPGADGLWRLLLAFDDSPTARRAVELCTELPLAGKASIRILTVMPMIHMYRQDVRQELNWIWQEKKAAAQLALEWAAAQIDGKKIPVTSELIEGTDISHDIVDAAAADGNDLIIVGHKDRSALQRFLLGSVTARIAHHAPCSVLSVHAKD